MTDGWADERDLDRLAADMPDAWDQRLIHDIDDLARATLDDALERAEAAEAKLVALARDVVTLANDYSVPGRDVIAEMPFRASLDQLLGQRYGIFLDDNVCPACGGALVDALPHTRAAGTGPQICPNCDQENQ